MLFPESHTLIRHQVGEVVYYTFPVFEEFPFVKHGFSTRLGGVSTGIFESMNLSFTRGDTHEAATENFRRFCTAIGVDHRDVVVSAQTHLTNIYTATEADRGRGVTRERGYTDIDGLVTDRPGVVLCTQYADCVPLFFLDPVKRVVATSHAGWRGTVAQIGRITVERMVRDHGCAPADIRAAIGPSIGPCCFEVDDPVYTQFVAMDNWDPAYAKVKDGGKYDIDLWAVNRRVLLDAGVLPEHLCVTDLCTKCHPDLFWSHRVTGGDRGSLAGFISLTE